MKKIVSFLKKNRIVLIAGILVIACFLMARNTRSAQTIVVIDTVRLQKDLLIYQKLAETQKKYLIDEKNAFESEKEVLVKKDKALFKKWEKLPKKEQKSSKKNPLKKEVDALRSQIVELQQRYQNKMEKIGKSFNKARAGIHRQAIQKVHQWGKEKGYTLVVPKHVLFYAQDSLDKTNEFIEWFNKNNGEKITIPTLEEVE